MESNPRCPGDSNDCVGRIVDMTKAPCPRLNSASRLRNYLVSTVQIAPDLTLPQILPHQQQLSVLATDWSSLAHPGKL